MNILPLKSIRYRYAPIALLVLFLAAAVPAQIVNNKTLTGSGRIAHAAAPNGVAPLIFTVTTDSDSGPGSLRQAISDANANVLAQDTINFDAVFFSTARTIVLTSGELSITDSVNITGPGADLLTVSGNNTSRIFFVDGPNVSLTGMTMTAGNGSGTGNGGAVQVQSGGLSLDGVHVTANTTNLAGGIYFVTGDHQITNSTFSNNFATATAEEFIMSQVLLPYRILHSPATPLWVGSAAASAITVRCGCVR